MTSSKNCGGDVFLIIYFLICTLAANGYCDNNFNKNYKETFKHRISTQRTINELTDYDRNAKGNYTEIPTIGLDSVECGGCNTTGFVSDPDCHSCVNGETENSEHVAPNNKIFKLNYKQNDVNETIYSNVNFPNSFDRQRRDVIDESSTSGGGLHGKWK